MEQVEKYHVMKRKGNRQEIIDNLILTSLFFNKTSKHLKVFILS